MDDGSGYPLRETAVHLSYAQTPPERGNSGERRRRLLA
jgi:hypothetical protein